MAENALMKTNSIPQKPDPAVLPWWGWMLTGAGLAGGVIAVLSWI